MGKRQWFVYCDHQTEFRLRGRIRFLLQQQEAIIQSRHKHFWCKLQSGAQCFSRFLITAQRSILNSQFIPTQDKVWIYHDRLLQLVDGFLMIIRPSSLKRPGIQLTSGLWNTGERGIEGVGADVGRNLRPKFDTYGNRLMRTSCAGIDYIDYLVRNFIVLSRIDGQVISTIGKAAKNERAIVVRHCGGSSSSDAANSNRDSSIEWSSGRIVNLALNCVPATQTGIANITVNTWV